MTFRTCVAAAMLTLSLTACQSARDGVLIGRADGGGGADGALLAAGSDYRRTVGEGVAIGAIGGAIAGSLIGRARGGDRGMAEGAVIGGLAGAALGGVGGVAVAENKQRYVAAENRLDGEIAEARAANGKLLTLLSVARRLVAERRAEAAALRRKGRADLAERRAFLAGIRENQRVLDASVARAEKQRDDLRSVAAAYRGDRGSGTLSSEARSTGETAAALREQSRALGEIGRSVE